MIDLGHQALFDSIYAGKDGNVYKYDKGNGWSQVGGDGTFNLYSSTGGNFIVDVTGYYDTVGAGGFPRTSRISE